MFTHFTFRQDVNEIFHDLPTHLILCTIMKKKCYKKYQTWAILGKNWKILLNWAVLCIKMLKALFLFIPFLFYSHFRRGTFNFWCFREGSIILRPKKKFKFVYCFYVQYIYPWSKFQVHAMSLRYETRSHDTIVTKFHRYGRYHFLAASFLPIKWLKILHLRRFKRRG